MRVVTQLNAQPVTLTPYRMILPCPAISIPPGRYHKDLEICYGGPDYLKFRGALKAMGFDMYSIAAGSGDSLIGDYFTRTSWRHGAYPYSDPRLYPGNTGTLPPLRTLRGE